uniref:Putative secreted protein n=1 Tax=Anopheles marajoara TaxID=58244 RepID=A0A2M4CD04_9DIPT
MECTLAAAAAAAPGPSARCAALNHIVCAFGVRDRLHQRLDVVEVVSSRRSSSTAAVARIGLECVSPRTGASRHC